MIKRAALAVYDTVVWVASVVVDEWQHRRRR